MRSCEWCISIHTWSISTELQEHIMLVICDVRVAIYKCYLGQSIIYLYLYSANNCQYVPVFDGNFIFIYRFLWSIVTYDNKHTMTRYLQHKYKYNMQQYHRNVYLPAFKGTALIDVQLKLIIKWVNGVCTNVTKWNSFIGISTNLESSPFVKKIGGYLEWQDSGMYILFCVK